MSEADKIKKEVDDNWMFISLIKEYPLDESVLVFFEGKLVKEPIYLINNDTTMQIEAKNIGDVIVVNLAYGKLYHCFYLGYDHGIEKLYIDKSFIKKTTARNIMDNYKYISKNNSTGNEVIFRNGILYKRPIVFGRYKGIGWEGGRTHDLQPTAENFNENDEIYTFDMSFGRIRRCVMVVSPYRKGEFIWMPEDEKEKFYK